MLFIAVAYYHLTHADPDCGTTFSWATRAIGPYSGWMGGWVILATDILVMPGLAQIAGTYSCHLFGFDRPVSACLGDRDRRRLYRGDDRDLLSRHRPLRAHAKTCCAAEVVILMVFAAVALTKVYSGHADGTRVALDWFNPFTVDNASDFTEAMLVAVFSSAPFRLRRRSPAPRPSRGPRAPARSALQRRGVAAPARLEGADGGGFERFVVRKPGRARRRGSAMREQIETRCHGRARAESCVGRRQAADLRLRKIALDPGAKAEPEHRP